MKQDLLLYAPNNLLRRKAKKVQLITKSKVKRILRMFGLMYRSGGIGLAAPQIGWNSKIFIIGLPINGKNCEFVFINPEISEFSDDKIVMEEGCLSMPGLSVEIERPESVTITATDLDGSEFTLEASGLLSRCIQHEFDHLSGILMIDKRNDSGVDRENSD